MSSTSTQSYDDSKPPTTHESIAPLLSRLFPQIQPSTNIKELNSYDDRNYLITCSSPSSSFSTNNQQQQFILKVTNSVDSAPEGLIEGQNDMMLHLDKRGFEVPVPIKNVYGNFIVRESLEDNSDKKYAIRLLRFVPGARLCDCPQITSDLLRQCGSYLARLQLAINDGVYSSEAIRTRQYAWGIESAPLIRRYFNVLDQNPERKVLVEKALERFETEVLAKKESFAHAYIHHDFNEQNILVSGDPPTISGVIDFGDICYVPRVVDLAICITYVMLLDTGDMDPVLEAPKFVLKGFLEQIALTEQELKVLLICSTVRLAQSVTMGAYTYSTQPGNEYLLTTQVKGWKVLEQLMGLDQEELVKKWIGDI